jgi:hypothetical protein
MIIKNKRSKKVPTGRNSSQKMKSKMQLQNPRSPSRKMPKAIKSQNHKQMQSS